MDKLSSMKAFMVVANTGSITAAAVQLGLSKSMVSKHMAYLENMLDSQLLHRSSRGVRLTELGEQYLDQCKQILSQIEDAEFLISQHSQQPRGTLRVTAPTSFGTYHLAPKIANYEKMFPEVNVELTLEDILVDLVEGRFDLAIRLGKLDDSSLIARKITETELLVCAAPTYLKEHGLPHTPADLIDHNCLIYKPSTINDAWIFRKDEGEFYQQVSGDFVANTGDAIRMAAVKERGLLQLPSYVVSEDIEAGKLQTVLNEYQPDPVPIYAVYPKRKNLSATVREFIDYLYSCYQPAPEEAR